MNAIIETTARVIPEGINVVRNSNDSGLLGQVHTLASREWFTRPKDERFEYMGALKASVGNRRRIAKSRLVKIRDIEAVAYADDDLRFETSRGMVVPTNWAFSQMSRHVGAPAGYLRSLPAELAARCYNTTKNQKVKGDVECKAYLHMHPDYVKLAAATGPKYGRIYDAEVVEMAERLIELNPQFHNPKDWSGKGSGLFASDHDVFIFLIDGGSMLDVGPRAQFNQGVIFRNSEVGDCTFEAWRFFFNVVCGNLMIWNPSNVSKLSIRHTKGGPERFFRDGWATMQDLLREPTTDLSDSVTAAQNFLLEDDSAEGWVKFFQPKGFTKSEVLDAHALALTEEPNTKTLWSAIQGFTASARELDFADARFELATRAGKLMETLTRA